METRTIRHEHERAMRITARRELHAIAMTLAYFHAVDDVGGALRSLFPELTRRLSAREFDAIVALAENGANLS